VRWTIFSFAALCDSSLPTHLDHRTTTFDLFQDSQQHYFLEVWASDFRRLEEEYFQLYLGQNRSNPRIDAFKQAIAKATGKGGCAVNAYSGAFFWFVVMTTIGYGNESPVTVSGRALVYTFGMLSILAFGGILFLASAIISFWFENRMKRYHWQWLHAPWAACMFFACLCYGWMALTALIYQAWNNDRLGLDEETSFRDAFWWSYLTGRCF